MFFFFFFDTITRFFKKINAKQMLNVSQGNRVGRGWNNHIHILDLDTLTWSQPITKVKEFD